MHTKFLTLIFAVCVSFAFAQPVKKTSMIKEEEVPAAIRQAFINDFGSIPEHGTWTVNFNVTHEGDRTMAHPTGYTFHKKEGRARIEVRYDPYGKLDYAKGLDKS